MPITLDGTNGITTPSYGGADAAEYLVPVTAFKNRIINGAMVINQRAFNGAGGTNGTYTLDRWCVQNNSGASRYTVSQNAGSVTPPAGFVNYLGLTSSGAYSVTSTDVIGIYQQVEGFNWADMNWGSSNAKTATLSFWVRSSITGTYSATLLEGNTGSVSYPATYTISSANTWEYKTVTIPGPTTGSFQTGNLSAVQVLFNLGTGSTYLGTANTWNTGAYFAATGQTNWVGTNGATFYVTGVQLEVGTNATFFDTRPYTTELQLCQRYYQQFNAETVSATMVPSAIAGSTSNGNGPRPLLVSMRATPTLTNSAASTFVWSDGASNPAVTNISYAGSQSTTFVGHVNFSASGTLTQFRPYYISANSTTSAFLGFSAEL